MQPARRRRLASGGRTSTRTSCTECRRRRQRCDQKQPCGRCSRRYPPPICHYGDDDELNDPCPPSPPTFVKREPGALVAGHGATTPIKYESARAFSRLMEVAHRLPGARDNRDNEVLHIYIQLHDQHTGSLGMRQDGRGQYHSIALPMCVQRPLLSEIFLYLGSCFLAEIGQLSVTRMMDAKGRAIHHLNVALANTRPSTGEEIILAIILIINNELCHGLTQYLLVHVRGLRDTVKLCGGLGQLGMKGLLAKMAITSDLATALAFESRPLLQGWQNIEAPESPGRSFMWSHNTPLCTTLPDFSVCADMMRVHPSTASILDDMRVLTRLVLDQARDPTSIKGRKLRSTAVWLQNRIRELPTHAPSPVPEVQQSSILSHTTPVKSGSPPPIIPVPTSDSTGDTVPDYVYQCVRQTALMFCRTVLMRKPFEMSLQPSDVFTLWGSMWCVPLDTWASILGVFVWIQTIIAPAALVMPPAVAVKSMFPVSMLQLGTENWEVAKEVFGNALRIQDWLKGDDSDEASMELTHNYRL